MPQQVRRGQEEAVVRKPLTPEQAREIAKKSHQRLQAQRQPIARQPSATRQPPMPENVQSNQDRRGIQIALVKRPVPQSIIHNRQIPPPQPSMPEDEEHLTKDGEPDRRYGENRALPPPPRRRDSVGMHLTKGGKPDRRYVENQHLTEREAEIEKAKDLLRQSGIRIVE